MYAAAFATNRYRETQDKHASGNQILMRLLRGCIEFVDQADAAIARKDLNAKGQLLHKASAIVDELMTPFAQATDPVSLNIVGLYRFARKQLTEAHLKNNRKALANAKKILLELESMFNELIARQ